MNFAASLRELLGAQRRQVFGLVEVRGVGRMRHLYDSVQSELERDLAALKRKGRNDTFTAHQQRAVLLQVQRAIREVDGKMADHLRTTRAVAADLAPRHLVNALQKLSHVFGTDLPIIPQAEAAVFQNLLPNTAPSLLSTYQQSVRTYGSVTITGVQNELSKSLIKGETVDQAVDRIASTDGVFAAQRWRAERIVRTETAHAYNATNYAGMQELQRRHVPRMKRRLVETFDDRTGDDSKILHGQIRAMGEPFVYVPPKGKRGYPPFMMPPGRPNDRAVVIPWMDEWSDGALGHPGAVTPTTQGLPRA